MPSIVVSNASPLILLSGLGEFGRLQDLFGEVFISSQVFEEVVVRGKGRPGSAELSAAAFVRTSAVSDPRKILDRVRVGSLAEGEASTIALAVELRADLVLVDEKAAREVALGAGLKVAGTLRVLELAYERRLLPDLRATYLRLNAGPAWIAPSLLDASLARFGLSPL